VGDGFAVEKIGVVMLLTLRKVNEFLAIGFGKTKADEELD
jgi:hypothetical protein